uniref:Carbonic anhydrase n=2 Tax=Opuntia streptacantha TaxID=393608 RepID=A0A7C8ZZV0_OPUST
MNHSRIQCFSHLLFLLILSMVALVPSQEVEDEREFDYVKGSEVGPEHWGELRSEWAMCKKGKMQSPIDLLNQRVEVVPKSEEIHKFYNPSEAVLKNRGHDIEIKWKGENSKILINGTEYFLRQAHWHSPSEHSINGKRFAMELHMVHLTYDKKIAVIGLLYDIGQSNPFLEKLMKKIESISDSSEEVDIGVINPAEIEMRGDNYYRYMGSLTTPPCSEGVLWTVNKQIATVSEEQVALLREAVHDSAEENARPSQPVNGRKVRLFGRKTRRGGSDGTL